MNRLRLRNGLSIAFQEWKPCLELSAPHKKVLAIHGWLDNSNSFRMIAPLLAENGYHVYAYDNIGHGRSSHLPQSASYSFMNYIAFLKEFVDSIGFERGTILGHSMGAGVGLIFSGTYPEHVENLVMIDGFGPVTSSSEKASRVLRKSIDFAIKSDLKNQERDSSPSPIKGKVYPSLSHAISARVANVSTYPGKQFLSQEAAHILVSRGVRLIEENNNNEEEDSLSPHIEDPSVGPLMFRHDSRLLRPSPFYLSPEQVLSFVDNIQSPSLLLTAENGWPASCREEEERKMSLLTSKNLFTHLHLPGSHHLHLDPEHAPHTSQSILSFLLRLEEEKKKKEEEEKEEGDGLVATPEGLVSP